jgi:acyl-CoA synthetase (AMP-forming)/AMP-acid ligase II
LENHESKDIVSLGLFEPWNLRPMPQELRAKYLREGWWDDSTLGSLVTGWLGASADLTFRVWSRARPQQTTFAGLRDMTLRLAAGLAARGIGPGDAVCVYVPNSVEGAVAMLAVPITGAAVVPVAPFYGMKELRFILGVSRARLLITCEAPAGGRLEAIRAMREELPALESVYVIEGAGAAGPVPSGMLPYSGISEAAALAVLPRVDPDSVAAIAFTSGTTSNPKGVVHTHRSLCFEVRLHSLASPRRKRPLLAAGPIAHATGMIYGLLVPPYRKQSAHIMDGWDPAFALQAMRECDLSTGLGAPYFLNSIFNHPDTTAADIARIEAVSLGGASVPVSFSEECEARGIKTVRGYGLTEHPTVTLSDVSDPRSIRHLTDGYPEIGCEVRLVDASGKQVPDGEPGELLTRGPDLCAGYIDPAMNVEHFLAEGWFRTGDVAVRDANGCITITDRVKDIIVRNGVKIGAVEVEDMLLRMPGILECAVVAAPDARTGEHGHAFLKMASGAGAPSLEAIRRHLDLAGLAKQKWPESIEVVDDFPRTPSGKVKKFELRARVRERVAPQ